MFSYSELSYKSSLFHAFGNATSKDKRRLHKEVQLKAYFRSKISVELAGGKFKVLSNIKKSKESCTIFFYHNTLETNS